MNKDGYDLEHFLEREHQTNLSLLKLIEIYEERINEAIEYIETTTANNDKLNCTKLLAVNQVEQLLEILKGEENDKDKR